jgi:hypothetical protein
VTTHDKGPEAKREPPLHKRIKRFLPFRSCLKSYLWMPFVFLLVLVVLSWLFGRHLGYRKALVGGLAVGAGVLLHIIDREG